ncbi:MAG: prepilin peptidase [Nitrococcus mobilis]|nr:prepilin peptidase [Nitrococcus mobilis]
MTAISILDLLQSNPRLLWAASFVLGLMVGSFLNVVILRLPRRLNHEWRAQCAEFLASGESGSLIQPNDGERFDLLTPPSQCPLCRHRLRPWENIPLLSYLLLRGRCSSCNARISPRYPTVELLTGVLSVIVVAHFGVSAAALAALVLTWVLIALAGIDLDHQLLPDDLTLSALWLGLLLSLVPVFVPAATAIVGAVVGYLALWSVYHLFRWLTGKQGMGYGDFKLLGMLGAWLGWQALPLIVVLASIVGAAVGIALIAGLGRHRDQPIPFGPFLAAAGWIYLLWGDELVPTYLALAGLSR